MSKCEPECYIATGQQCGASETVEKSARQPRCRCAHVFLFFVWGMFFVFFPRFLVPRLCQLWCACGAAVSADVFCAQASNVDQVRVLRSQRGSLDADVHMLLNEAELEEYLSKSLKAAAHRYSQHLILL